MTKHGGMMYFRTLSWHLKNKQAKANPGYATIKGEKVKHFGKICLFTVVPRVRWEDHYHSHLYSEYEASCLTDRHESGNSRLWLFVGEGWHVSLFYWPRRWWVCSERQRLGQYEHSPCLHQKGETQTALDQPQFVSAMCYRYILSPCPFLSARVFQVYLILASQLLVTTAIVAVFTFVWVYRVCVLRACFYVCLCVTVPLFLTANLSEILYGKTKQSTGHHSKCHPAVPSLPFKAMCFNRNQNESLWLLIYSSLHCIVVVLCISSPTLCWSAVRAPGECDCSVLQSLTKNILLFMFVYKTAFNLLIPLSL